MAKLLHVCQSERQPRQPARDAKVEEEEELDELCGLVSLMRATFSGVYVIYRKQIHQRKGRA